jgi:molybdate transport system substrate-binding protein
MSKSFRWRGLFTFGAAVVMAASLLTPTTRAADAWDCPPVAAATPPASPVAAQDRPVPFPEDGGPMTVFAAASLTDTFTEIEGTLEESNPGLDITFNFAGSQALLTQLQEGATADVAAFAATAPMATAVEDGLTAADPVTFAWNRLTVVVPSDNPAGITSPSDLGKDGVKLVLAAPEVPAGNYARQSVCLMAADPGTYGDDFIAKVAGNIVSEEDNVRSVLAKVTLGEADAGFVYTSDVTDDVTAIKIPDDVNVIADYPIAPLAEGNAELADAFISFVLSDEGQAILERYGFLPVSG